jgi:hypothetical protein
MQIYKRKESKEQNTIENVSLYKNLSLYFLVYIHEELWKDTKEANSVIIHLAMITQGF